MDVQFSPGFAGKVSRPLADISSELSGNYNMHTNDPPSMAVCD